MNDCASKTSQKALASYLHQCVLQSILSMVEDIPVNLEWHINDVNARKPSFMWYINIGCPRKLGMWCIFWVKIVPTTME